MAKKLSDYIPILKDQGIDYVAAAPAAGVGTYVQTITPSGGASWNGSTVTLDHTMADTNYAVLTDQAERPMITIYDKTATSFVTDDNGYAGTGTVSFVIVGQLKGLK
jgi:hypothetical protein